MFMDYVRCYVSGLASDPGGGRQEVLPLSGICVPPLEPPGTGEGSSCCLEASWALAVPACLPACLPADALVTQLPPHCLPACLPASSPVASLPPNLCR